MTTPPNATSRFVRQAILFEGALGLAAVLLGAFIAVPPWRQFHWTFAAIAWGTVAAAPPLVMLLGLRLVQGGPIGRLNRVVDSLIVPMFAGCTLGDFALISLVAGLGEEMLFRGVVQPVLIGWMGPWGGLILASLLFGLAHFITPTYALLATIIGGYLGWLMLQYDNLLITSMAHAVYDFAALAYMTRRMRRLA